jgi:hypothetical protein
MSPPSSGQAVVRGLDIVYIPDPTITTPHQVTFTYSVTNSAGTSSPVTITVTVNPAPRNVSELWQPPVPPPPDITSRPSWLRSLPQFVTRSFFDSVRSAFGGVA